MNRAQELCDSLNELKMRKSIHQKTMQKYITIKSHNPKDQINEVCELMEEYYCELSEYGKLCPTDQQRREGEAEYRQSDNPYPLPAKGLKRDKHFMKLILLNQLLKKYNNYR